MSQAERDLENARYEITGGFNEWACFLSQQAAEKAAKAVFQKLGADVFGHSVAGLLQQLPRRLKASPNLIDAAKELDKAYIAARYPNAHPQGPPFKAYTKAEATRLVRHAEKTVKYCKGLLSKAK